MGLQSSAGWEGVMPNADKSRQWEQNVKRTSDTRMLNVQVTLETLANLTKLIHFTRFVAFIWGESEIFMKFYELEITE